jgi:pyruvate,water dikinase
MLKTDASERVLDMDSLEAADIDSVGAKAHSLVTLKQLGLPVPSFACVVTALWDELVDRLPSDLLDQLENPPVDRAQLAAVGRRARDLLIEESLPDDDAHRLDQLAHELAGDGGAVSVRSSAIGEDAVHQSFAGQFDTYLWVSPEDVNQRTIECLASAFSDRALLYRRTHGLGLESVRMAVVVQRMIDSASAGIAFTVDPVERRTDRILVVSGLGLGEGIVDGAVATDSFRLDRSGQIVGRTINAKTTKVVRANSGGTALVNVAGPAITRPSLLDRQVEQIAKIAQRVAQARGAPQDIEWALDADGRLHLLQARPVTTVIGRETVFDNSNLIESFPGWTSPLTFSLMRKAYQHNFLALMRTLGVPSRIVERNRVVFENLVGSLNGRMYYNLTNWYRVFLTIPGLERAVPAFEEGMGFEASSAADGKRSLWSRLRWAPIQLRIATRLALSAARLRRGVQLFQSAYQRAADKQGEIDLGQLGAHDLLDRIDEINRDVFWQMHPALLNDFITQQVYAAVGGLIESWDIGDAMATRNELLCGETGMDSVEPVRSLVALVEGVACDPAARALLESPAEPAVVYDTLTSDPRFNTLGSQLREHVERYGARSLEELKLETRTFADDPLPIVQIMRNLLRGGRTVEAMEAHEQTIRARAERNTRRRLRTQPLRRLVFSLVLSRCRAGLKARERMRLTRGRVVALLRACYRALGERLAEDGLLENPADIVLLTVDEVADAVRGSSVSAGLRGVVAERCAERDAFDGQLPARIHTHGIVLARSPTGESDDGAKTPRAPGEALHGIACASGRVQAPAKVIADPSADMNIDGEVLVARSTDPGWVLLMVAAKGLVTEQGNVLSHTAIIGRELGIPTVVGVPEATRLLADGVEVELDGSAGTVTVVDPSSSAVEAT